MRLPSPFPRCNLLDQSLVQVLVLWADKDSENLGVRAIADGMTELAKRAWGRNIFIDCKGYSSESGASLFGSRSIARDLGRKDGPIKSNLRSYDIILDSGAGDSFTDIYGLKRLVHIVYASTTASRLHLPVVMGPQTIGPFNTWIGRCCARLALKHVCLVQTRDGESAVFVESLGRSADVLATDVVFLLPGVSVAKSRDVILNVSGLLWFSDQHLPRTKYRRNVRELVRELEARGRKVSFLAHVVNEDHEAILSLLGDRFSVNEVLIPQSLEEVRRFVASGRLVIGSRMHACLNALSVGTPAICWAYSRKFAPLMHDIGWELVIDIRFVENPAQQTLQLIDTEDSELWNSRLEDTVKNVERRLEGAVTAMRHVVVESR